MIGLTTFGLASGAGTAGIPVITLVGSALVAIACVTLANWRAGLYLFLAWIVFEDLPRKYLGNNMLVYFGKDALAFTLYFAFFVAEAGRRTLSIRKPFLGGLVLFAGWCLVQVFNPASPSIAYGLVGLRLYLYYVPLMLLGYSLVRKERDLLRFLTFGLSVAAIVATLGIVQGVIGLDFLNPRDLAPELFLARLIRQAPISDMLIPRPTSVFVSDARFAWYMLLMFLLGVGTVAYLLQARNRLPWAHAVATGLISVAIVISGRRAVFIAALVSTLVVAAVLLHNGGKERRAHVAQAVRLGLAMVGLASAVTFYLFPGAVAARWAFYYETLAPWSHTSELALRAWASPVANLLGAFTLPGWQLGNGIGTSSLGAQYVVALLFQPTPGSGVESGYGAIILELGIIGVLLWLFWTAALVGEAWKIVWSLRHSRLFPIGLAIAWFAFLLLFPFTISALGPYQDFVLNSHLWLLTGILFRLRIIALAPKPNREV